MRDNNDNNVDDKLEQLALLGGIAHFKGQQQALQQSAKQTEEVRRLRESAERDTKSRKAEENARKAEENARKAEESRIGALPQCPICGGRLEGQFRKCKHCSSDLSWVEGVPCEPGKELELQERLNQKRRAEQQRKETLAEEDKKLQAEMLQITNGLPAECPRCFSVSPGRPCWQKETLQLTMEWAASMSKTGLCQFCVRKAEDHKKAEMAKSEKEMEDIKVYLFLSLSVVFLLILLLGLPMYLTGVSFEDLLK